jgi:hypothetical protein
VNINKHTLHHWLRAARQLRTWQLLIILVLLAFVSATLLRLNNIGMVELRAAVLKADAGGNQQAIRTSLGNLQQYVSTHMNADLGPGVYLQGSYDRARDTALQAANNSTNPNSAVYQQASIDCRSRFVGGVASFRNDYVQCVVERVGALSQGSDPLNQLNLPKADLYRYDFVSPIWSPDFAGFSVLLAALLMLFIICKILFVGLARLLLRKRQQRI